jgi:hypothetical protein
LKQKKAQNKDHTHKKKAAATTKTEKKKYNNRNADLLEK